MTHAASLPSGRPAAKLSLLLQLHMEIPAPHPGATSMAHAELRNEEPEAMSL